MPPGSPTRAPPGTGFGVRSHVDALVREALTDAIEGGLLRVRDVPAYAVHEPADPAFGDLTCDVAMVLAREIGQPPQDIACILLDRLRDPGQWLSGVEVAGPGFVNFRLGAAFWRGLVDEAVMAGAACGRGAAGRGRRAHVLRVGAVGLGPPGLAEGRCTALAGSLARLLGGTGWVVDAGDPNTSPVGARLLAAIVDADDDASAATLRGTVDPAVLRLVPVAPVRLSRGGGRGRSRDGAWPDVVREIGDEPARFFVLLARAGSPLDLDLEQARRPDADNPLSRVQLAHPRPA